MKKVIEIQLNENNIDIADLEKLAKEDLKNKEVKLNSLAELKVYYKPASQEIFYVAVTKDGQEIKNETTLVF